MRCNAWEGVLLWWSCQPQVAQSYSLLNHRMVSAEECSSLMQNVMQIRCSTHSVILNAMATQYTHLMALLSPLSSTVKLSLFTHEHSSPLSLAVRLHQCHANLSLFINNGWTFSGQTSFIYIYVQYICAICLCVCILKLKADSNFHIEALRISYSWPRHTWRRRKPRDPFHINY